MSQILKPLTMSDFATENVELILPSTDFDFAAVRKDIFFPTDDFRSYLATEYLPLIQQLSAEVPQLDARKATKRRLAVLNVLVVEGLQDASVWAAMDPVIYQLVKRRLVDVVEPSEAPLYVPDFGLTWLRVKLENFAQSATDPYLVTALSVDVALNSFAEILEGLMPGKLSRSESVRDVLSVWRENLRMVEKSDLVSSPRSSLAPASSIVSLSSRSIGKADSLIQSRDARGSPGRERKGANPTVKFGNFLDYGVVLTHTDPKLTVLLVPFWSVYQIGRAVVLRGGQAHVLNEEQLRSGIPEERSADIFVRSYPWRPTDHDHWWTTLKIEGLTLAQIEQLVGHTIPDVRLVISRIRGAGTDNSLFLHALPTPLIEGIDTTAQWRTDDGSREFIVVGSPETYYPNEGCVDFLKAEKASPFHLAMLKFALDDFKSNLFFIHDDPISPVFALTSPYPSQANTAKSDTSSNGRNNPTFDITKIPGLRRPLQDTAALVEKYGKSSTIVHTDVFVWPDRLEEYRDATLLDITALAAMRKLIKFVCCESELSEDELRGNLEIVLILQAGSVDDLGKLMDAIAEWRNEIYVLLSGLPTSFSPSSFLEVESEKNLFQLYTGVVKLSLFIRWLRFFRDAQRNDRTNTSRAIMHLPTAWVDYLIQATRLLSTTGQVVQLFAADTRPYETLHIPSQQGQDCISAALI